LSLLTKEDEKNLRQEYDNLRQSIWSRGQTAWLLHSIMISGSLLVVLSSFQYSMLRTIVPLLPLDIPIGSLLIVAAIIAIIFSLYIQYTDLKLNDIMFQRMHEIEAKLGMVGPGKMFEAKIQPKLWHKIRRYSWFGLFAFLIVAYTLALLTWLSL